MASTILSRSSHRAPSALMLVVVLCTFVLGTFANPFSRARHMPHNNTEARFPADGQTEEQKAAFAEAEKLVAQTYGSSFQLKDAQGNLLGPFGVLSYTPTTFIPYLNYSQSFATLPYITPKERELSVLATTSVTKNAYILYAHKAIGISVGLTAAQAQDASEGRLPKHLQEREIFVFELALKIAKKFGTLDDKLFDVAVQKIGRDGIAQLSQVVGGYLLAGVLVNVADVAVPTS